MHSVDVHILLCDVVQCDTRTLWSSFNFVVRALWKQEMNTFFSQENVLSKSPRIWLYPLVAPLLFKARALTVFPSVLKACNMSSHRREIDNLPHCPCGGESHHSWAVAICLGFQRNRVERCEIFLHEWTCFGSSTLPHQKKQWQKLETLWSKYLCPFIGL